MGWNLFRTSGNDELLDATRHLVRLMEQHAEVSKPGTYPDPIELEQAAEEWRRWLRVRLVAYAFLVLVTMVSALMWGYSRVQSPRPTGFGGVITSAADTLDMGSLTTLAVTATGLVASVTIAVVAAPQASAATHPADRVAAAVWAQSVSLAAFVLAAFTSGLIFLALFRSSVASSEAWYLAPLTLANSFLAIMTTTRAQDEVAVASPQRDLLRVQRKLERLSGATLGAVSGATPVATGRPSSTLWGLRWMKWAAIGALLAVGVSLGLVLAWADVGERQRVASTYVAFASTLVVAVGFVLYVGETLRIGCLLRGWRRAATCCAGAGTILAFATTAHLALSYALIGLLVAAPSAAVTLCYLSSFVAIRDGYRLSSEGGLTAHRRHEFEVQERRAHERIARSAG